MNRQEFERGLEQYKGREFNSEYLESLAQYIIDGLEGEEVSPSEAVERNKFAYDFLGLKLDENLQLLKILYNKTIKMFPRVIEEIIKKGLEDDVRIIKVPLHTEN